MSLAGFLRYLRLAHQQHLQLCDSQVQQTRACDAELKNIKESCQIILHSHQTRTTVCLCFCSVLHNQLSKINDSNTFCSWRTLHCCIDSSVRGVTNVDTIERLHGSLADIPLCVASVRFGRILLMTLFTDTKRRSGASETEATHTHIGAVCFQYM